MLTPRPRVAVLFSRRCPGLENLLSGHRRREFDLVCAMTTSDEGLAARDPMARLHVPLIAHSIRPFLSARGLRLSDMAARRDYDRATVARLAMYRPDLVLLSSYLFILTDPVLEAFPGRIANVHGSDLARTRPDGRPLYPGLAAVRDAIRAGESETRATAHVVTERLDDGPILLRSRPFPVSPLVADLRRSGNLHAVNAYAHAHEEWMLLTAWGPLLTGAVARLRSSRARAEDRPPALAMGARA
jgi:folate-dependent phosphoribosylglycinamide formyltransferase PurN